MPKNPCGQDVCFHIGCWEVGRHRTVEQWKQDDWEAWLAGTDDRAVSEPTPDQGLDDK